MSKAQTRRQRDYTLAAPTEAERQRRGTDPRVRFGVCNTCGARLWLSGLGIGSHERSARHNRPALLAAADRMQHAAETVTGSTRADGRPDSEWYAEEAARLRAAAEGVTEERGR